MIPSRFERYEKTLDGTADLLKEYSVGIELFGKPESYDPREDAAIRVAVSKLRQKLEEYYVGEGKDDSIVIELPRRRLALTWHGRLAATQLPIPTTAEVLPVRETPIFARWRLFAAALILFVVAFLLGRQFDPGKAVSARTNASQSAVDQFWRPLLADGRPVRVALGTPMFVRMHGVRVRAGQEDIEGARADPRIREIQSLFKSPYAQSSYIYTGVGEATAAFELAKLFTRWNVDLQISPSSSLTWDEIRNNNLIILGSAKYNPQIRGLPVKQSFFVEKVGVINLHPGPGEPSVFPRGYSKDADHSIVKDYVVISRLPGVNGHGTIIILGASATEGTAAAAYYATDPIKLRDLFEKVKGASAEVPKYFEAVLSVEFRAMVPIRTQYETHHVLYR